MGIELFSLLVRDYDEAIDFFVDVLDFRLVDDSPSMDAEGNPKRWVVVRPRDGSSGLLLTEARGPDQERVVGRQFGGRVGLFLHVDDFGAAHERMLQHDVCFEGTPRDEPYGRVAVFEDILGNKWDLIEPKA